VLQAAVAGGSPLGQSDEAETGAVAAVPAADAYRVSDAQVEAAPGTTGELDGDRGVRRVLARVRQCLLHDPVGAATGRLRQLVEVLDG